MKSINNKLILTMLAFVTMLFNACDEGDAVVDDVVANTTRGAILRTVNLISNELPIGVADAEFSVELEVQDEENGALVDNIEVYLGFRDNSDDGGPDLDKDEILATTLPSSSFTIGEFDLPRTSYSIPLTDMLSSLGLSDTDIDGGDQFTVRFELVLTDGRRFSFADNSGTLTGSFFSSPFLYTPTVVCLVPEDKFVGTYILSNVTGGPFGTTWGQGTEVTLSVGEVSTQRVFSATYLPQFAIGNGPAEFVMDLVCGEIIIPTGQSSGLQCVAGISFGPPKGEPNGTYDVAITDDSVLTFAFFEDEADDCGGGANVIAELVKQ